MNNIKTILTALCALAIAEIPALGQNYKELEKKGGQFCNTLDVMVSPRLFVE